MYYLIDCNQFFVSCEQLFNARLKKKPVVVLSNNDGIVVARSKEAKALGIPMGAAAFQYEALFKEKKVFVLSSNYSLYGDISQRVMAVLSRFSPNMEEYSIDEAFLYLESTNPTQEAEKIKKTVQMWTGIPISIGMGKTKTLAKVASDLAKNTPSGIFGFFSSDDVDNALRDLPPKEIWGIGSRLSEALHSQGIRTALALKNAPDEWLKKKFSIAVQRMAWELRGIECLSLQECPSPKQSITCSRSFGRPVTELSELNEAVSSYTANVAEKLRQQSCLCSFLSVFLMTSPFQKAPYSATLTLTLSEPSCFSPLLINCAKEALKRIYKQGFLYKKVGVILGGLVSEGCVQRDLFSSCDVKKQKNAMELVDKINDKYGKRALHFAAEGVLQSWRMKRSSCSPCYTTKWSEVLHISI